MKIDKDKFPALFDDHLVLKEYSFLMDQKIIKMMADIISVAKTNLTYIANTIMTPMLESYDKLINHRKELRDSCRGLMFISKRGHPHIFMYTLFVDEPTNRINIMGQVSCVGDNKHMGILFAVYIDRNEDSLVKFRSYNTVPPIYKIEVHDDILQETLRAILAAELFINFAEIETKVMQPRTQIWDERGVSAVYNNKTDQKINLIDSTWYTNLVVSGAFKVRGHFRLQPYGPGHSQRRLKWISDFEKSGYTRKAKISVNQNDGEIISPPSKSS